jgi:flagellar hook-associated protein FlgK
MRDREIPAVSEHFGQLITAFVNRVNRLHLDGYGLDGLTGRAFFADHEQRRFAGVLPLAANVTLDTTLDELGVTSGDFFVQGQHIMIDAAEAMPGTAITLGALLRRIEDANIDIRAELDDSLGFSRIVISQYNPVAADTPLTIKDGSSNFFELVGLDKARLEELDFEPPYQSSLYNFKLNSSILNDLNTIAATGNDDLGYPGPGDNRTALAIADLKNDNRALFATSFNEFYQGMVSTLGSASQTAQRSLNTQQLVVDQLEERREEVSGVNLDEEAINLVRYQKAFEASARALNTIDETLELIVNRLGIAGR